jgi:hypothetical protein
MFRDEDSEFTTVPAAPGWYVCVLYDGLECLTDEPIVAWEIERWASSKKDDFCRTATPICTENYFNDNSALNDGWMLRDPSGCYHDPDGSKFDTVDEALAHLQARRRRHVPAA